MNALDKLRQHLRPGQVYRRAQLVGFSNAVDRHLKQLVELGELQKLKVGVYYRPQKSTFGNVPPDENKLVEAFLKDTDFLIVSLNSYNAMGVGTTQLYNEKLVYNHKRDGRMKLNGQRYYFLKNRKFPKKMTEEFMLVDLVNNLDLLAENKDKLKNLVMHKIFSMNALKVMKTVKAYGKVRTQKFFDGLLSDEKFANVG
ncbi:MAG: hypothetical protein COB46_14260 [Rhodospirillaceae bacterium]|nr:MAG: hypothetical protein COB46_14260 [Rhodospirillaceae bacterium]